MERDYKARKQGLPTTTIGDRLKSMIKVNPITGCWEWQGSKKIGYGHTIIGSRKNGTRHSIAAHRLAYLTWKGEIPEGYFVCHKCDNPSCINPEHLFVGTRQDNVDDRERKGRNVVKTGEEQPLAKLTKKAVKDARWEYYYKRTKISVLAKMYGVSYPAMKNAIVGKTWKCVTYFPPELQTTK